MTGEYRSNTETTTSHTKPLKTPSAEALGTNSGYDDPHMSEGTE